MNNVTPPLFIIGGERSGTTLLRTLLNKHPDIVIPPESHFISLLHERYSDFHGNSLAEFIMALLKSEKFSTWEITKEQLLDYYKANPPKSYRDLIVAPYHIYMNRNGKKRWGDKNPVYAMFVPLLIDLFPKAKFIHIIRDGRDAIYSLKNMTNSEWDWLQKDISTLTHRWMLLVDEGNKAAKRFSEQILEISYENFVQNPDQVLRSICEFANLEFFPELVTPGNIKDIPEPQKAFHPNISKPISSSNIGKGLRELTDKEIHKIQILAVETLLRNDYALVGVGKYKQYKQKDLITIYRKLNKRQKHLDSFRDKFKRFFKYV